MKNIFINMLLTPFLKLRHYKLELSFFSCQTKVTHPKRVFCYCFIVVIVTDRNHYGRVHTCFYLYPYLTTFTKNTACTRVRWHMFLFLIFFCANPGSVSAWSFIYRSPSVTVKQHCSNTCN